MLVAGTALIARDPVKVAVRATSQSIRSGAEIELEIALQDASNWPARAPKAISVDTEMRPPSGAASRLGTVTFEPGEHAKRVRYALRGQGLLYIWAGQRDLLGGGTFVKVTGEGKPPARRLALRYSPRRRLLANGHDRAIIQAFLIGDNPAAATDIRIRLANSAGALLPVPLRIPSGGDYGEAELTSDQAGAAVVEYMSSDPPVPLDGDHTLQVQFDPPVSRIEAVSSPPGIGLLDSAQIVVTLTDDTGKPVPTAIARKVSFAITSGHGVIQPDSVSLAQDEFTSRVTFSPVSIGDVTISVSTPNLLPRVVPVTVKTPWALLGLSLLGGLAGAWIGVKERRTKQWRILAGALTGLLFYWALLFGLLPVLGRAALLNPLSAFAVSIVGGWAGTLVLKLLWKRLVPALPR